MQLAFVNRTAGFTRGGAEIWDLKLAESLRDMGVEVTFYVGRPVFSELPNPPTEFDYVEVPTPQLRDVAFAAPPGIGGLLTDIDSWVFAQRVLDQIRDREYDIIQVCSRPHFSYFTSKVDPPVTLVMHGTPWSLWYDVLNPFSSSTQLLNSFDHVITTGTTKEKIEDQVSVGVATVNPGIDTEKFTPRPSGEDGKSILFVGRFVPAKNLFLLLESFESVLETHPESELTLIGDGPLRKRVERKIGELGINERVRLLGPIENERLPNYYNEADVFVLSSAHESFGIVILEAMSCGTPVVAPTVGWAPRLIEHGENGLLFDTGSKSQLVEALDRVLDDAELRNRMSERSRQKAVSGFDWDYRARELKSIYEEILSS
ncbi:glycosyltransferase family 4 protein [Halorussus salinisoli]|uniref:glycosyltransferase family 4 protein n=1 Tax=Halorussus salinisoli TaxID=2558242 RepID=UPI0010C15BC5|nr:glycosyltransferase family 4 protein [Halorussus salinisoli]